MRAIPAKKENPAFQKAGFARANQPTKKRMVMALDGLEKQGKTHFALTAPEPIAIVNIDMGLDGVVQKFQEDKEIYIKEVRVDMQDLKNMDPTRAAKMADDAYKEFLAGYKQVLGVARTIIWDTGTELWELLRMARFGKLTQVKPHHYGPVNAEYRELIRLAMDGDTTNLIILHKLKDEYKNESRTGNLKRAGMSDTAFLVQFNGLCWRETGKEAASVPDCFHMTITDCRQNAELSGMDVSGADLTFPTIATLVFPDTEEKDWL